MINGKLLASVIGTVVIVTMVAVGISMSSSSKPKNTKTDVFLVSSVSEMSSFASSEMSTAAPSNIAIQEVSKVSDTISTGSENIDSAVAKGVSTIQKTADEAVQQIQSAANSNEDTSSQALKAPDPPSYASYDGPLYSSIISSKNPGTASSSNK